MLTRRGMVIVGGWLLAGIVLFNWWFADKAVVCDWRGGFEPCVIAEFPWVK